MAKGIVDLVDRDYSFVRRDARFGIKPLRTRPSSFAFMSTLWRNWRKEYLKRKLEKQKEALLQESFEADANGALSESSMKKMERKTEAIAGLEQRLKFLSKETVPRNFVSSHAIKLRRNMFEHLTFNGRNAYSVGLDKYDEIFGDSQESNTVSSVDGAVPVSVEENITPVDTVVPTEDSSNSVNVVPTTLQREAIQSSIEAEFAGIENKDDSNVQKISPQDVEMAVTGKNRFEDSFENGLDLPVNESDSIVNEIESNLEDVTVIPEVEETVGHSSDIPSENVSLDSGSSITEDIAAMGNVQEDVTPIEDDITTIVSDDNAVNTSNESSIDAALQNIEGMPSIVGEDGSVDLGSKLQDDIASIATSDNDSLEGVRVSQNGSSAAKIDHFTDEGESTYREWIPLTDEQIAAAQRDLAEHPIVGAVPNDSFEVREEDITSEEPVRDEVVVAPDREVHSITDLFDNQQESDVSLSSDSQVEIAEEEQGESILPTEDSAEQAINSFENDASLDSDSQVEVAEEEQGESILPTEDSVEQIASSLQHATTLEEFRSLKEAVEELQRKQKETNQEREEAERRAKEREEQAKESERIAHEKQALLSERMARLNEYREALLEDCNFNENKTRSALSSVEASERIIAEQENSVREADDVIAGIDSLIGPQAVNVTVKGR